MGVKALSLVQPRKLICLATVRSKITQEELLHGTIGRVVQLLTDMHVNVKNIGIYDDAIDLRDAVRHMGCEGLILIVGTGGTEPIIYNALRELNLHTLLVAYEGYNSLPAMLEAYAALRYEGKKWINTVFLELARVKESKESLLDALKPLFAIISMKNIRIGMIGKPSPWLVYSKVGKADVKEIFGAEIIDITIERLAKYYEESKPHMREIESLLGIATPRIRAEHIEKALRLYYALRQLVDGYALAALSVECFRIAERLGVTPCYALARLNSEDVDAGCEGDIPSLLTLMLLRRLSDQPAMMGNIASLRDGDITIAHCTAPLSMAINYMLDTHMETGLGVGVAAKLPSGRQVTLAKLDLRKRRTIAFTGRIVESGMLSPRLCRTQVIIKTGKKLDKLLEDPVGSHLVLTIGNVVEPLRTASRLLGLEMEIL